MMMFCKCTDTDPDFVVGLLRLPRGCVVSVTPDVEIWVCHDCWEHMLYGENVRFVTDQYDSCLLWLEDQQ